MRKALGVSLLLAGLCLAFPADAQYIGILQSAETVEKGTTKLMIAPMVVLSLIHISEPTRQRCVS
ncbi:MAG: hypothetical protein QUU85_05750, partial [Candidatus Eisenbacteria bacterium]|nr:hypothetical protein [Candidatus Eisenbacteria bacterium]